MNGKLLPIHVMLSLIIVWTSNFFLVLVGTVLTSNLLEISVGLRYMLPQGQIF